MKIAVTYENGNVFPHFGRTKNFKVYTVEDGAVVSSEILDCGETGHEALAWLLSDNDVEILLCGGLGSGAQDALIEAGIDVISGVSGDTDAAVADFLQGDLESEGVNCDHHDHHEDHEKTEDEAFEEAYEELFGAGSGCGGGCSSCGSSCGGGSRFLFDGKNVGKVCRVHYRGTFNDGTQFDSSYDRGEPLEFVCGIGRMIPGFDMAVADMEPGEEKDVHLMPEEAYGMADPRNVLTVQISQLPGAEDLQVGERVSLMGPSGQSFAVTVTAKDDVNITMDANHEMAGKELNFHIEMVEVR